jgi:pimeloyl-ACP methyl ester carboxylesterase
MRGRLLVIVAAVSAFSACSSLVPNSAPASTSAPSSAPTSVDGSVPAAPAIEWQKFSDDGSVQTAHLDVPIDYTDPAQGTFTLALARHLANPKQRIGSLLVNPGGPGFGGTDYAKFADQVYSDALLQHFDIVAWDPRGTGDSTPAIDCIDDYDTYFTGVDITPDTPAERQLPIDLAKDFADQCLTKNKAIWPFIGTNESARDMDTIRRALGEATISYFGFSYGSELGSVWATLFPDTVRAAVLDGATDPNADFVQSGIDQAAGFEQAIATFLARCSADTGCAFHNGGNAEAAFDALMTKLDDHPIPTESGRPDLTRSMALGGVAQAMYSEPLWPQAEQALADAQAGDGAGLLELFDEYFHRRDDGTWENFLEAFQVISCQDHPTRLTVAQDDATAPQFQAVAPRFSPSTIGSYFCTFFPPSTDPEVNVNTKGARPIVVVGTTGDPATPLATSRKMAEALDDGRLVIVHAEGHTGYAAGACSGDVVDTYLIDPSAGAPADGTECT